MGESLKSELSKKCDEFNKLQKEIKANKDTYERSLWEERLVKNNVKQECEKEFRDAKNELEEKIAQLQKSLGQTEANWNEAENDRRSLEKKNSDLEQKVDSLTDKLTAAAQNVETLQNQEL